MIAGAAYGKVPFVMKGIALEAVGVEDAAHAMVLAGERGRTGERYIVSEKLITNAELVRLAAEEGGVPVPRRTISVPVLYGMAAASVLGRTVREGRLFYSTTSGAFRSHTIALDEDARRAGREVFEIVERAITNAALMAAPKDRACERCDYRAVCGPDVARRAGKKRRAPLADLIELRSRR